MPRGNSLFILKQLYILETLNLIATQSDLNQIGWIFFLRGHNINSKFSANSEYFILVGDKSYFK